MERRFSNQPDLTMLAMIPAIKDGALFAAAVIPSGILGLWFFAALDPFAPHLWSKMTANTAIGLLLSAAALFFTRWQTSGLQSNLAKAFSCALLLLSVATLAEYAAHFSIGIDTVLPYNRNSPFPGRPSPQSAMDFTLLGICLLTLHQAKSALSRFADIAVLLFVAFNFVMLGGEFFGALDLIGLSSRIIMAPQTLATFFCFGIVMMLRRAEQGELLAVLVNIGIGSRIVRLILPGAVIMPYAILFGVAWLYKNGWLSEPYAQSIIAAAAATFALCIITWLGWRINGLERELRDLSLTDELTGVFNRRGFYFLGRQAISEAQRAKSGLSLFFFDLDGLKGVNDRLGHEAGSEMIRAFAAILTSTFRKSDIVGRVGGDEFAVITISKDPRWIDSIYARLSHLTESHNAEKDRLYRLSFSLGYAAIEPGHADTLDSMITRADGLMYEDKAKKKELAA